MRSGVVLACVWLAACTGEIVGGSGGADGSAPALSILAPDEGSVFTRDALDEVGALAAAVGVEVEASGVDRVEVFAAGALAGEGDSVIAYLRDDGPATIRAVGYDAAGDPVTEASVDIAVEAPQAASCHEWLDLYRLEYTLGPDNQGVDDPVTVTTPINGIVHRYVSNDAPRETFFMHCELALALAKAAPIMRERDVVELVDIGVYNYRCIGGGTPPDCPNGISQHAYAKAIDIAGFTTADDVFYSVNDDWIVDADSDTTCGAATEGPKDEFLHEIICAMKAEGIWNIVLTPNYNDAHRNHFHVDLTEGSDFIRREGEPLIGPSGRASAFCTH